MEVTLFDQLSLREKESLLKEKGELIEAQDFYSFYVLIYVLGDHTVRAVYDFSGSLLDLEEHEETDSDDTQSDDASLFSLADIKISSTPPS